MVDFTREESWGVLYVFGIPVIDGLYAETVEQRTTWENRIPSLVRWASSVRWTLTWTTAEEYRDATGARHYKPKNAIHGAQAGLSFADAYEGARDEVAIWKKRALEAEDLSRKFVAEINGPTYMGEPAQPAPSINEGVRKVTLGFRWESEAQHHIPTIEIEFDPVSPNSPNDAKSWQDRDRLAAMLTPEAKP